MAGLVIGFVAVLVTGVRSHHHKRTQQAQQDYLANYDVCTCQASGSCATCAYYRTLSPRERKRARKQARKAYYKWSHGRYPCASWSEPHSQSHVTAQLPVVFMQQSGTSQYPAPQNIVRTVERRASFDAPPKYDEGSWNERRRSVEVLVPAAWEDRVKA